MDPTSTVRTDSLPAIATLVAPGAFAGAPFACAALAAAPTVSEYLAANAGAATLIAVVTAIGIGLFCESLGSYAEFYLIDKRRKDYQEFQKMWWQYLRIAWDREPIGQRYLRQLLVTFKFELNMAIATSLAAVGVLVVAIVGEMGCIAALAAAACLLAASYLFFCLSRSTSGVLADVRRLLLKGVGEPPFDSAGNPTRRG